MHYCCTYTLQLKLRMHLFGKSSITATTGAEFMLSSFGFYYTLELKKNKRIR